MKEFAGRSHDVILKTLNMEIFIKLKTPQKNLCSRFSKIDSL